MKTLNDYIKDAQTKAIDKAGAFFAFSEKQFNEGKKDGVKYTNGPHGMICPHDTLKVLLTELKTIHADGIAQDVSENGLDAIIRRELNNHEAFYTGDTEDTWQSLSSYPITREDVDKVFRNKNFEVSTTI